MKKIALFADGTGNSSASPHKTNVWRAYKALDRRPGSNQVAFYDNGVGTTAFTPFAIFGLAFGWGLARNVRQIYGFLCRAYDPGDEVYAFGFSRGAFTIRLVVGLITHQGIIDRTTAANEQELDRLVSAAYRRFRHDRFTPSLLSVVLRPVRDWVLRAYHCMRGLTPYDQTQNLQVPPLKFLGVWDTVDAYGLPVDELTRAWDMVVWPLTSKDRELAANVEWARHALSLDEQRESFHPMLWNEGGAPKATHIDHERLAQVWFPGVHANVGGGYPDDALAFTPLVWILEESHKRQGLLYLRSEYNRLAAQRVTSGPLHDSRGGYGMLYRYAPRDIERLNHERKPGLANRLKSRVNSVLGTRLTGLRFGSVHDNEVEILTPVIHHSVFERIRGGGDGYAPLNVPADYAVLTKAGTIVTGPRLYEQPNQAACRRARQGETWNKVLLRTILYHVGLAMTVALVAYPYLASDSTDIRSGIMEVFFGTLSVVVRAIPEWVGRVPGLGVVGDWAVRYEAHPLAFVLLLGTIGVVICSSRRVGASIQAEMRELWHHVSSPAAGPVGNRAGAWRGVLSKCRDRYGSGAARRWRIAVEALAVGVLLFSIGIACSRSYFTVVDGFGGVCEPVAGRERVLGEEWSFDPKQVCFDTGVDLTVGQWYELDLRTSHDWRDKAIDADAKGWVRTPWYMYGVAPLRRHWLVGWYEPVARIGEKLFDRYPLTWYEVKMEPDFGGRRERLLARFQARRSGRLYLYMRLFFIDCYLAHS